MSWFPRVGAEGIFENVLTQVGDESWILQQVLGMTDDTITLSKQDKWRNHARGKIMHSIVAVSYRHPSRVNTDKEQKEHASQP